MVSAVFVILGALGVSAATIIGLLFNIVWRNGKVASVSNATKIRMASNEVVDILRPSWCKTVLNEFGEDCCHLFDYVRKQQGDLPWGTVLDAGTGIHSLDWLLNLPTTSITAITGDPKRQAQMEDAFKNKLRPQDSIITGNWKDSKMLEGKVYDVVLADYLLGSLDGYAPYFQDRLFERIKPHVGKRLYVVGAEPLPDKAEGNPHAQIVIEIAKLRDACILLAGDRPYREYPLDWTIRNLRSLGYHIHSVAFFETTYHQEFVESQINVAESKLGRFKNDALAETMQAHIDKVRSKVHKMNWGVKFGSDYVIVAVPMHSQHQHKDSSAEDASMKKLKNYKSPIEEQKAIFPMDEH